MALGRRKRDHQDLWVATCDLPRSPGHPFYTKLNMLLDEAEFDAFVEGLCKPHYDHRFEPLSDGRCRLTWVVDVEGFGASILGRIFAALDKRNLNRAIPRLIREICGEAKMDTG